MFRLVIADDEKAIRDTIASFIDWKSLDIDVVSVCKNGNEAYDAILDEFPDIVLTDIRMPGMTGLEMIQRLKEVGGNIQFIILSGYGEFDYAKKAMELGVQYYLLKPCNENEIIRVIEKAKEACRKSKRIQDISSQQYTARSDVFSSRIWTILENAMTSSDSSPVFNDYIDQHKEQFFLCRYISEKDVHAALSKNIAESCHRNLPDSTTCFLRTQHNLYLLLTANENDIKLLGNYVPTPDEVVSKHGLGSMLAHLLSIVQKHGQFSILVHDVPLPLKGAVVTPKAEEIIGSMKDSVSGVSTSNKIVDKTIQYMKEHLADPDVSLKNIADTYLFMNVDYVSKQFVKYTGKRFSSYLNELRIDQAKKLLSSDVNIKINTVADAVGCANNPQYFNYIFKKQTGITPSAYQQSVFVK